MRSFGVLPKLNEYMLSLSLRPTNHSGTHAISVTPTSQGLTVASPMATPTTPMLAPIRLGTAMASCIGAI